MESIFITNLNREEYKELLRETFREILTSGTIYGKIKNSIGSGWTHNGLKTEMAVKYIIAP